MWYIVALFALIIVGIFDGHISSVAAMSLLYVLGLWSVNSIKNREKRLQGGKVFGIVFSVYVISAFIASRSFLDGQYFYVSDPMKYIEQYGNVNTWDWNYVFIILSDTYLYFADNNGLFNQGLSLWAYIANHFFDGTTVFYLTFFQTLFGVLASLEIYKIFTLYFEHSKAAKYTCIFAILSLFHIYSVVIIRDIVIAYFYMLGLRKIMGKPKISDLFVLLFVMLIATGVRLYTGLFFGAFIMFWAYKLIQNTKYANYRIIIVPLIVTGIVFVGMAFASSVLVDSTAEQIETYNEKYSELSGIAVRLRGLPVGVRHIAILFFSQLPLDSFHGLSTADSFSNYHLAIFAIVYKLFGFIVFYGTIYHCFIKGFIKKMDFTEKLILIIMLVFVAITLSTHIDVRRSMEAIPIFFLVYMLSRDSIGRTRWLNVNRILIASGILIMITYAALK